METQTSVVKVSLTTKLVLMIAVLLIVLIGTLNITARNLFTKDKVAYIYDLQATAVSLAGREYFEHMQNVLGDLRIQLGSFNFQKPDDQAMTEGLKFLLNNQTGLVGIELFTVDEKDKSSKKVYQYFVQNLFEKNDLKSEALTIDPGVFNETRTIIEKQGYAFVNISKIGFSPALAVFFSDANMNKEKKGNHFAIGYVPLKQFYSNTRKNMGILEIFDSHGGMIFNSEFKEMFAPKNISKDEFFKEIVASTTATGAKEISAIDGKKLISFNKPGMEFIVVNQIGYDDAMKSIYTLNEKFTTITIGMLGVMIIAGLLFAKRMTSPLLSLFQATEQVSKGQFEINLQTKSTDEIGVLTRSFVSMSHKISDLIKQMVDKMRVEQELGIAKAVQQSLFPEELIEDDRIMISSHYQSASECGGDWWGTFRFKNKQIVAISDATGHGLPSALITAAARSFFSMVEKLITSNLLELNPSEILSMANRVIYDSSQGQIMMTYFVGIIDYDKNSIEYSSAAHNPPWILSKDSNGQVKMASLTAKGVRLGEARDVNVYEIKKAEIKPGDNIFFYTDGIIEGKNLSGIQYGKKKVRKMLEENINDSPNLIIQKLVQDFLTYNEGKTLDDDITLALFRVKK